MSDPAAARFTPGFEANLKYDVLSGFFVFLRSGRTCSTSRRPAGSTR